MNSKTPGITRLRDCFKLFDTDATFRRTRTYTNFSTKSILDREILFQQASLRVFLKLNLAKQAKGSLPQFLIIFSRYSESSMSYMKIQMSRDHFCHAITFVTHFYSILNRHVSRRHQTKPAMCRRVKMEFKIDRYYFLIIRTKTNTQKIKTTEKQNVKLGN